mmetsp:Transcript_24171/g.75944  ORF Transcript_24171/g.75944 Transcript_24171/m.75944 type:complete len:238 (+) Transcript_24171:1867-2580(+)
MPATAIASALSSVAAVSGKGIASVSGAARTATPRHLAVSASMGGNVPFARQAGLAAAAVALSASLAAPAFADLNKFEAGTFGEFGQGSAQQFGGATINKESFKGRDLRRSNFTAADIRESDFSNTNLLGAYLIKTVAYKTDFTGANLSDSLMDRGVYVEADFTNAILKRVILTLSDLNDAKIEGADFTDALIDRPMQQKLCRYASGTNPTTGADTRRSLGCGSKIRGSPSVGAPHLA